MRKNNKLKETKIGEDLEISDIVEMSVNDSDQQTAGLEISQETNSEFNTYLEKLKVSLSGIEDATFKWKDVSSFLIIKLSSTDCLRDSTRINSVNKKGKASNIQITAGKDEDKINFFPLLELNDTFNFRRLRVHARLSNKNIKVLDNNYIQDTGWIPSVIQVWNRGFLNEGKNPVIHICYDGDLDEIRKRLGVDDYMVIVKQKNKSTYEAFGVLKETADLGNHKKIYIRDDIANRNARESTIYDITEIAVNSYIRVLDLSKSQNEITFYKTEEEADYYIGDELWAVNSQNRLITDQLIVTSVEQNIVTATVQKKINERLSKRIFKDLDKLPEILKGYFKDNESSGNEGE